MINKNFWKNKNILITGHTGFKGGWLSVLLNQLGANQRQKIHAVEYFKTKNVSHKNVREFLNKG